MFGIGKLEERIEKLERYVNLLEREILNVQEYCKLRTENKTYLKSSIPVEGTPVLTKNVVEKILEYLNLEVERLPQENEKIELVSKQKVKVAKVSNLLNENSFVDNNGNLLPEKPFAFEEDDVVVRKEKKPRGRKKSTNSYIIDLLSKRIDYLTQLTLERTLTHSDIWETERELVLAKNALSTISQK